MAPKKGGKKGGGKKGGGKSKSTWQPTQPPDHPIRIQRIPRDQWLSVQVRGVVWRAMDFTERVPATLSVHELRSIISQRHGGGVLDFTLYKEEKHARNLLSDPAAALGELEFTNAGTDAERVIYYDFEPRVDDCPLLLRPPHNLRIEALAKAEEDEKAKERLKRQASRGGPVAQAAA
jgi:hypothetical protein